MSSVNSCPILKGRGGVRRTSVRESQKRDILSRASLTNKRAKQTAERALLVLAHKSVDIAFAVKQDSDFAKVRDPAPGLLVADTSDKGTHQDFPAEVTDPP